MKFYFLLIFSSLVLLGSGLSVYADHGSGGGGCSGDCIPPTLGSDNSGREFVQNGFGINDKFFTVGDFEQDIPTQIIYVGDSVELIFRIYENEGPQNLSYVGLMLGLNHELVNGIQIESHNVQIDWNKSFDGVESFDVIDNNELISDVQIQTSLLEDNFGLENNITELRFSFVPLQIFDTNTIIVQTWDNDRNSWSNYFLNAFEIHSNNSSESLIDLTSNPEDDLLLIPNWIKSNANLWSQNQISDDVFLQGIKYCIDKNIINIPNLPKYEFTPALSFIDLEKGTQYYLDRYYNEPIYKEWFDKEFPEYTIEEAVGLQDKQIIPIWIKNNADLWANDVIDDEDFVNGIKYLIEHGIIILN